jgi:transcriptional regulator with XRE-family HTH domain
VHERGIIRKKEVFFMNIGDRIKARRVSLGWSQRELATRVGYKNHSVVARIEAGTVDLPQSRIEQFARVLGVTHGYLIGLISEAESKKNDQLAKLIVKMRTDVSFYKTVAALAELTEKQRLAVDQLIAAFDE